MCKSCWQLKHHSFLGVLENYGYLSTFVFVCIVLGNCNFDSNKGTFCSWRQEKNDDKFDWTLQQGSTPSGSTGPSKDHSGKGRKSVYLFPFKCTKITKLIIFQFKLVHRRLATNSFLKKIGIKQSDLCTFCKTEEESLIHLFWSCGITSIFWQEFKQWITTNYENVTSNFSLATVLG